MYLTLLLFDVLLFAFFAMACVFNAGRPKPHPDIYLDEFHHGYLGDALVILGWATSTWWLILPGVLLRLDDTVQHVAQLDNPRFDSPIHALYVDEIYWRYAWVRKLNAWLDRRFGAK